MRTIFTTGQAAKVMRVAPRTVRNWFEIGRIKGYRLELSGQIRIPREQLVRFMREHGMPTDLLD